MKKLDTEPHLIKLDEGYLEVAKVEFGRKKPRVKWFETAVIFKGVTKKDILDQIDKFRAKIAKQKPLKPSEYEQ